MWYGIIDEDEYENWLTDVAERLHVSYEVLDVTLQIAGLDNDAFLAWENEVLSEDYAESIVERYL